MKTKIKTLLLAAVIIFILPKITMAQSPSCNYFINNGSACTVSVQVDFYTSCYTTPCASTNSVMASATAWFPTCGSCMGTLCDIVVTINGGTPVNVSTQGTMTNVGSLCMTANITATWDYDTTSILDGD
jgi:hypothetical protein